MMVISFKKGMAAPFFPFPVDEIWDKVINAELVWGRAFDCLWESLREEEEISRRFQLTEDFLLSRFRSSMKPNPCVAFAIGEMIHRPDSLSVKSMNNEIGYSQKHFIEMFREQVGVTPKAYLKIMRFQKAVRTIDGIADVDWGILARECGFYDLQSRLFSRCIRHYLAVGPCGRRPDGYLGGRDVYSHSIVRAAVDKIHPYKLRLHVPLFCPDRLYFGIWR